MFINKNNIPYSMVRHKEGEGSSERYYNKLRVQLIGRGYTPEDASAAARIATAKRYQNYGIMTVAHGIVLNVMAHKGINKVFYAPYFSFVNAYLKQVRLGNLNKAEQLKKEWIDKGADAGVINEIVDKLGSVIA